jgi:hypothetical protein
MPPDLGALVWRLQTISPLFKGQSPELKPPLKKHDFPPPHKGLVLNILTKQTTFRKRLSKK